MKSLKLSLFALGAWLSIGSAQITDPVLADCVHYKCCLHTNQDISPLCWDNCGHFQGHLANMGCHILDPSTLPPPVISHAPDPTVTLLGPTNFCQGLSPGGSSCMTISAGCYAISPLWNYSPATTCTGQPAPTPPPSSCTWGCVGWKCDGSTPCASGSSCQSGTCRSNAACTWGCQGWNCNSNSPCQSGYSCQSGTCKSAAACTWGCEGWNCDSSTPCQTGTCQSGYCKAAAAAACSWGCEGWNCDSSTPCQTGSCQRGYCSTAAACAWGCEGWNCDASAPCQEGSCQGGYCKVPCSWGCEGWQCSSSSPCQSGLSCNGGTCGTGKACSWGCDGWNCDASNPCQAGSCRNGICKAGAPCAWGCEGWTCSSSSPCQSGLSCNSGYCRRAEASCTWGCAGWKCDGSTPCQSAYTCQSGYCRAPASNPACDWGCPGWDCSPSSPCRSGLSCSSGGFCFAAVAGCTWGCQGWECSAASPCQPGYSCQGGYCWKPTLACTWGCEGWQCSSSSPCQNQYSCQSGYCRKPAAACNWGCKGWKCSQTSPCQSQFACMGGFCGVPAVGCDWGCEGWQCDSSSPCRSQFSCQSGVCRVPTIGQTSSAAPTSTACSWGCEGWNCSGNAPCQQPLNCNNGICRTYTGAPSTSTIKTIATSRPPITSSKSTSLVQTTSQVQSTSRTRLPTTTSSSAPSSTTPVAAPTRTSPGEPAADEATSQSHNAASVFDDYNNDPTSQPKASAAKSAISDAYEAAKTALSEAVSDSAQKALNDLVDNLKKALAAATTAAAGPTAAAASAVAEAMAAVAVAVKSVENIDYSGPDPSPPPPTRPPNTTPSTTATSSSSSSTEACPLCVACADEQFWPSDETESEGDAAPAKRDVLNDIVNPWRRDLAPREVPRAPSTANCPSGQKGALACGLVYCSRTYVTAGKGLVSYSYTIAINDQRSCVWKMDFRTAGATDPHHSDTQTEHIYEAQMITQFVTYLDTQGRGTSCSASRNVKKFFTRTTPLSGNRQRTFTIEEGGSAMQAMMWAMSDNTRKQELVGLEAELNGLKAAVMNAAAFNFNGGATASQKLARVTQMAMLWQYMQTPKVVQIYKDTTERMKNIMSKLDDSINGSSLAASEKPAKTFLEMYNWWEEDFLFRRGTVLRNEMKSLITGAKDEVDKGSASQAEKTRINEQIDDLTISTQYVDAVADPEKWDKLENIWRVDYTWDG